MSDHDPLAPLPTKLLFRCLRLRYADSQDFRPAIEEAFRINDRFGGQILTGPHKQLLEQGGSVIAFEDAWVVTTEILLRLVATAYLKDKWQRLKEQDEEAFVAATCNIGPAPLKGLPTAQQLTESHDAYDQIASSLQRYRGLLNLVQSWKSFQEEHQEALQALAQPYRPTEELAALLHLAHTPVTTDSNLTAYIEMIDAVRRQVETLETVWPAVNRGVEDFLAQNREFIQQSTDQGLTTLLVPLSEDSSLQEVENRRQQLGALEISAVDWDLGVAGDATQPAVAA